MIEKCKITKQTTMAKELAHQVELALRELNAANEGFEIFVDRKAIEKYMAIENKTPEVLMAIASCYWQLKDYNSANKYYLEILAIEPNNKDALINSAYAYYSSSRERKPLCRKNIRSINLLFMKRKENKMRKALLAILILVSIINCLKTRMVPIISLIVNMVSMVL